MKKKKVIIAIHGLKNKPPKFILKYWWKKAIREGFKKIKRKKFFFKFEMAYWADIRYDKPLIPYVFKEKNTRFLDEPYAKGKKKMKNAVFNSIKLKILNKVESVLDSVLLKKNRLIDLNAVFDLLIKHLFEDLDVYFHQAEDGEESVRSRICARLAGLLKKYSEHDILLISHSMGTIISYDVLRLITPEINVHTFLTIGSPLGLPYVIENILKSEKLEYKEGMLLPTPGNIGNAWYNLSDPDDKVTIIYRLGNNYKANNNGINPEDIVVCNDYEYKNNRNPHKSYGYLRAPECAEIISRFFDES